MRARASLARRDAARHPGREYEAPAPTKCRINESDQRNAWYVPMRNGRRPKHDELSSPIVGGLVPVVIRLAGPARRTTTDTERSGIQMTFQ
jgi:hypothetical protein